MPIAQHVPDTANERPAPAHSAAAHRRGPTAVSALCLLWLLLAQTSARAQEADAPWIRFNGYGTLGEVHSSEEQADFTSSIDKPNGAGHSRDWSADVDSVIAAQLTAQLAPRWSAMIQVVSKQRYDNSYLPGVEWANLKFQATPELSLRAGRVVMPSFLVSDDRQVGYAIPWVRPPLEVYSLVPITKNDGLDASYRVERHGATNTLQSNYGSLHTDGPAGQGSDARNQWGIYDTLEIGPLTVHTAYHQAHLSVSNLQGFFSAFRDFGPPGDRIANQYACDGKLIPLRSLGVDYDPGSWFLMSEWARSDSHCFIGAQSGWYVSGGYRLGSFTPYLTTAALKAQSNTSDPGLVPAGPPTLQRNIAALDGQLNAVLASTGSENSVSAGLRWDFLKNMDLKFQVDRIHPEDGSAGVLMYVQPGFRSGGDFYVYSMTLDFVF